MKLLAADKLAYGETMPRQVIVLFAIMAPLELNTLGPTFTPLLDTFTLPKRNDIGTSTTYKIIANLHVLTVLDGNHHVQTHL